MEKISINCSWITDINWADGHKYLNNAKTISVPSAWSMDTAKSMALFGSSANDILSKDEIDRSRRFHQSAHAERFIAGRIILRLLLAKNLKQPPHLIMLERGPRNKLGLSKDHSPALAFNLSYSGDRVLIAFDDRYPIGIDIERINTRFDYENMLEACFSTQEIHSIVGRHNQEHLRFFTHWTRKEALLKMTGEGIGEHLPLFETLDGINFADRQHIGATSAEKIQLSTFFIGQDYIGTLATEREDAQIDFYTL